jgi:hypothetical protein
MRFLAVARVHSRQVASIARSRALVARPIPWLPILYHIQPQFRSFHVNRAIMSTTFVIEPAKTARAGCKECKDKIEKDAVRIGKVTSSPFSDEGTMVVWYHYNCFFNA